eukprot:s1911_g3.t1
MALCRSRLRAVAGHGTRSLRQVEEECRASAKSRQWSAALRLLEEAEAEAQATGRVLDASARRAALAAAAAGTQWQAALGIFAATDPESRDAPTFTSAMTALTRSGRWREGQRLLADMESASVALDLPAVLVAIRLHGQAGRSETSLALLRNFAQRCGGVAPTEAYNACLTALAAATAQRRGAEAKREAVQELLREMRRQGVELSRVSFGSAMAALSSAGGWLEALQLLSEMSTARFCPDEQAFTSALTSCGRAARWMQAMELLRSAQEAGLADSRCHNAAMAALGRASLWQQVLEELGVLGAGGTLVSWNTAITACAEAAEWSSALQLLSQLSSRKPSSGFRADRLSFNAALTACRNAGRWREVLLLLTSMAAAGQVPDDSTLSTVTAACERAGLPERGLRLFMQLTREGASAAAPAYNAALKSASSVLLWREAVPAFHL